MIGSNLEGRELLFMVIFTVISMCAMLLTILECYLHRVVCSLFLMLKVLTIIVTKVKCIYYTIIDQNIYTSYICEN